MLNSLHNTFKRLHQLATPYFHTVRFLQPAALGGILIAVLNAALIASIGRTADAVVEGLFLFALALAATWGWREWRMERAQHRRLAQLYALAEQINTPFELNDVLYTVVDILVSALAVDHGALALLADDEQTLTGVVERRGGQSESTLGLQISCGADTPLAPLVRDHRELAAPDVLQAPLLNAFLGEVFRRLKSRAFLAVPLVSDAHTIGMVGLHVSRAPRAFSDDDIQLAKDLAAVAANAAQKARLLAKERRRNAQLVVINTVAQLLVGKYTSNELARLVAQAIAQQFGWIVGVFWLAAEQNELVLQAVDYGAASRQLIDVFRLKVGQGIVGWVAEHNQPLVIGDVRQDARFVAGDPNSRTRSELAAPIRAGDLLLGVLNVESEHVGAFDHDDMTVLQEIASDVGAALLNATLAEQVQGAFVVQTKLLDASARISAQQHMDAVLDGIMANAREVAGADRCSVMLIDAQGRCYLMVGVGYDYALEPHAMRPEGVSMSVMGSGQAVFIADVAHSPQVNPRMRSEGVRSMACLPLRGKTDAWGVMWVSFFSPHRFTPEEQAVLQTFANHAAIAIEQAHLREEIHGRLAELESLNRLSARLNTAQTPNDLYKALLDETLAMLGTAVGSFWLYNAARSELRSAIQRGMPAHNVAVQLGEGIIGRVAATGEPWLSHEFKRDPHGHAEMCAYIDAGLGGAAIPVRAGQEVIGVLSVAAPAPRELTPDEIRFMTTAAEMAGVAIQRARLHEKTQRQLQHITALHRIDLAISSGFDIHAALDLLIDKMLTELSVDAASVLLFDALTTTLEYAAGRGFRSSAIEETRLRLDQGHAGRAALDRRIVHIADLRANPTAPVRQQWLTDEGFITYVGAPLVAKGQVKGVIEVFQRAQFTPDSEWLGFLEALATQAAIGIDNAEMFQGLRQSNEVLAQAYDAAIAGWSRALDLRDKETEGHAQRVTAITVDLARALGLGEGEIVHIRRGALMHDIGKMGVPDSILLKPGPLNDEEWRIMRQHPQYAYEMLSPIVFLRPALDIPYCHHEKWDGGGYPRGLKGEGIPLTARIFTVADVWDALRSDRPYRKAWPVEQARQYIRDQSGAHFDPAVVEIFLALFQA